MIRALIALLLLASPAVAGIGAYANDDAALYVWFDDAGTTSVEMTPAVGTGEVRFYVTDKVMQDHGLGSYTTFTIRNGDWEAPSTDDPTIHDRWRAPIQLGGGSLMDLNGDPIR